MAFGWFRKAGFGKRLLRAPDRALSPVQSGRRTQCFMDLSEQFAGCRSREARDGHTDGACGHAIQSGPHFQCGVRRSAVTEFADDPAGVNTTKRGERLECVPEVCVIATKKGRVVVLDGAVPGGLVEIGFRVCKQESLAMRGQVFQPVLFNRVAQHGLAGAFAAKCIVRFGGPCRLHALYVRHFHQPS